MTAIEDSSGRFICSPKDPMPKGSSGLWAHTNVKELPTTSDYYGRYRCMDCGHVWEEELSE